MKANMTLTLQELAETDTEAKEMQHAAERIWSTITSYIGKYVTVEKDAIFNDPNWPHLWDRK